ncbi:MAG: hypothetical protein GC165_10555 [Armatimonadetes bacterium]|nr:hypothetical protein [Armatimonadota bacterium]
MKYLAILVSLLLCGLAFGQGDDSGVKDPKMKQPKVIKATTAPVTHAEAQKTFDKMWAAMAKGLKVKGSNPVALASDAKPITKNEVLAAMQKVVDQVTPMFKRSATPAAFVPARFRKDFDQTAFTKLVKDGFVMPYGPLVTGSNETVSTHDFGDAVGTLMVRISDLVHLPSRKYSPALMDGGN